MRTTKREVLGEGKYLRLLREGRWEFAERCQNHGAVAVIAITADERLILVEQYRPAVRCQVIDLPAGLTGDVTGCEDEPESVTANRELMEEAGYRARSLKCVAKCPTSPGLSSEVVSFYFSRSVRKVGAGGGIDHEEIRVHTPLVRNTRAWLARQQKKGALIDAKVYAGLFFAAGYC